jgi:hypothetical protein
MRRGKLRSKPSYRWCYGFPEVICHTCSEHLLSRKITLTDKGIKGCCEVCGESGVIFKAEDIGHPHITLYIDRHDDNKQLYTILQMGTKRTIICEEGTSEEENK